MIRFSMLLFILFLPSFIYAGKDTKWVRLGSSFKDAYNFQLTENNKYFVIQANGYTNFVNIENGDIEYNICFAGSLFLNKDNHYVNLYRSEVDIRSSFDGLIIRKFSLIYNKASFVPDVGGDLGKAPNYIIDYSNEHDLLAIAGFWEYNTNKQLLTLWDVGKGEYKAKLSYSDGNINCLKFIPNTNKLIIASSSELCLFDITTGQKLNRVDSYGAKCVELSGDNSYISYIEKTEKYIQGYGYEHKCIIRRVSDLAKVKEFVVNQFTYPFPFLPDNNSIVIIDQDQRYAEIRNITDDILVDRIELPKFSKINSAIFDKTGNALFFSEGYSGASWKYDRLTKEWKSLTGASFVPELLQYSPDGQYIAAANKVEYITIFDTLGNIRNRIKLDYEEAKTKHKGQLHFNSDNSKVVYCNEEEKRFQIFDVDPNSTYSKSIQESDLVKDVGYSPTGDRIAVALENIGINIYDASTYKRIASIPLKDNYVIKRMAFYSDKLIYALISDHSNQVSSLLKWNIESNEVEYLFTETLNYHNDIKFVFNSNNKYFLAYWDVINLEKETIEQAPYSLYDVYSMDISKNGSYFTIVPEGTEIGYGESYFLTWKLPESIISGKYNFLDEVKYNGGYYRIHQNGVCFSPLSKSLVSCSTIGDIILWNLKDTILSTTDLLLDRDTFGVYPQPATDILYIDISEEGLMHDFELYDMLGNKIRELNAAHFNNEGKRVELDITSQVSGAYILRFKVADRIRSKIVYISN